MANPVAILLMGPTASGKTEVALQLCKRFPVEIISVDSSQVYRGMDIGTAKPGPEVLARFPHRLIDIRDPDQAYSAAEFRRDALAAMQEIVLANRIPLLVGGSMFYFRALEQGLPSLPDADPALRAELLAEAERTGWPALHRRLAQSDPDSARRIDPNDAQRIQRALEIVRLTGEPVSQAPTLASEMGCPYPLARLVLASSDRRRLHHRIEARFRQMLTRGLVQELEGLLAKGDLSPALPAMRSVGYRQARAYLEQRITHNELINQGVAATRQLAKRQLTWLRWQSGVTWFDCENPDVGQVVSDYLSSKLRLIAI